MTETSPAVKGFVKGQFGILYDIFKGNKNVK